MIFISIKQPAVPPSDNSFVLSLILNYVAGAMLGYMAQLILLAVDAGGDMINMQMGLSYQNFNKLVNNQTNGIKFETLKALCDCLDCTPNDLFEEYHS